MKYAVKLYAVISSEIVSYTWTQIRNEVKTQCYVEKQKKTKYNVMMKHGKRWNIIGTPY